jgi:hypothetical protein
MFIHQSVLFIPSTTLREDEIEVFVERVTAGCEARE